MLNDLHAFGVRDVTLPVFVASCEALLLILLPDTVIFSGIKLWYWLVAFDNRMAPKRPQRTWPHGVQCNSFGIRALMGSISELQLCRDEEAGCELTKMRSTQNSEVNWPFMVSSFAIANELE